MDSLSFNRNVQSLNNNNAVSFTGQKSIINSSGTQIYRFYTPPYDKEKYFAVLELVSVDDKKNSQGKNTGELTPVGKPVLIKESIAPFASGLSNSSFDMTADQLAQNRLNKDMVGYRFVLLDKNTFENTKDIGKAREAAGNIALVDAGKVASGGIKYDFSFFSKKQGFVNKTGPMYHIMPDSYNVDKKDDGNEDFVRTPFNKAGGNIQGMIDKLREDKELYPYEMIITTPLFGGDDVSSHGYWTANPFQIASTKGTLEDFKELQTAMFDEGKTYVTDGAFTSFGLQAPQLQHVLKWGKQSPFYSWIKFDKTDAPNLHIKLGILPDTITPSDNNPESIKKSQEMLDNIRFKIVNPKYIESKEGDRNSKPKLNPEYNREKPTYIQFYDNRLAGSQADDLNNLITFYDNQNPDNHYDIARHQDSVQPFYFEVDPMDKRFQTRGASLKQLQDEGNFESYLQMEHYEITTKSNAGGANSWDGQTDLLKANISNPTNETRIGNKQVKNYYYNMASYWTKLTDDALIEHIANKVGKEGDKALDEIAQKHKMSRGEIRNLSDVITTSEFNNNFNKKFQGKGNDKIILDAIMNFPLESVEFAPDLTAALSTGFITPRPENSAQGIEHKTKTELLKTMPSNVQALYSDYMQSYVTAILGELDEKMPSGKKLSKDGNIVNLTEYGKFVSDIVTSDIMKYGMVKALFPDEEFVEFDNEGRAEYSEDLKYKGLVSLGINKTSPEDEAKALISKLKEGFDNLLDEDNSDLVNSLYARFKDIDLDDIKLARAVVNKTGAGLSWRFDAAKDVADLDKRRENNAHVSFEKCWSDAIDFWGGFIQNIRKYNPAAYTIAEVTNLWEFSRYQYSNKNNFALKNINNLESLSDPKQRYAVYEFYMANKDSLGTGNISAEVQNSLKSKTITAKALEKNPRLISDREFSELRTYFGINKDKNTRKINIDQDRANNAMQLDDFGKYVNPNVAERIFYEKTGATTGSNYDTFFGLYPELFGQNFEHGTTNDYRLYNMAAFEKALINKDNLGDSFLAKHSPQFINHSHIFTNNHDKPRPLHCMALDMEFFLSDFKSYDGNPDVRAKKQAEFESRAKAVAKSDDFDHISSMAAAVGERFIKMFENSSNGIISDEELKTVKQAIADLVVGKFLNHTNGSMERSRTFGYLPFDITLKDVIRQARFLSETKGMKWNISGGKKSGDKDLSAKETKLFNAAFAELKPDTEKLSAMLRMMMFSVGVPTLFAGDEMGHSGYETPTKNVELAIRNIVHHSWLEDSDKEFIQDLYNHTTAAASIHKMKGLSALADGFPLVVPQEKKEGEDDYHASHTALFKYNDKGSNVLVVYSNKQMDTQNKNPKSQLSKKVDEVSHIDLNYLDAFGNKSDNAVAKDGDKFRRLEYNEKTAQYEPKETYIVEKGKLYKGKLLGGKNWIADTSGSEESKIKLDDVASVFYKEN